MSVLEKHGVEAAERVSSFIAQSERETAAAFTAKRSP
jgi:hypothetical protein